MNIVQQVAASIGTAVFSVLLTNGIQDHVDPTRPASIPGDLAGVFAGVFLVATVMVAAVLVPAWFLPRRPAGTPVDPTVLAGH